MADDQKAFEGDLLEVTVLKNLGYQQELKRSFGLLGMISFSIVTYWTALSGVLIIGVLSRGPVVMIYFWIGIFIFLSRWPTRWPSGWRAIFLGCGTCASEGSK